jgi:DNA-binding NarL/FixJ family response regulator
VEWKNGRAGSGRRSRSSQHRGRGRAHVSTIVRQGLAELLGSEPGIEVVGEADDGAPAVELVGRLDPDVVLMDLVMPGLDGVEATRRITTDHPRTRVLALTSYGSDGKLFPALEAGAIGFLLKDTALEDLVHAIKQAAHGYSALSPAIAPRLMDELRQANVQGRAREPLTGRETEILEAIAHGLSNDDIADRLCISPATVRTHTTHVFAKLGLASRTQATLYALKHGIARLEADEEP